jgi:cysteinyl-tRNA synthetase
MLGGHYRQQYNFTLSGIEAARSGLGKLETGILELLDKAGRGPADWESYVQPQLPKEWGPFKNSWAAFRNDLNTPAALGALFSGLKKARQEASDPDAALAMLQAAGALVYAFGLKLFARADPEPEEVEVPQDIAALAEQRWEAKQARDFAEADRIRDELSGKGWLVVDVPGAYSLKLKS